MRLPVLLRCPGVALLTGFCPGAAWSAGVHFSIVPSSPTIAPGDTVVVELQIFEADAEFNGFDVNLGFDPARLTFIPTSPLLQQVGSLILDVNPSPFHRFTALAEELEITVVILQANTFVAGPGVIYRVKFRANDVLGPTALTCADGTQFYDAGYFVNPLECVAGTVIVSDGTVGTPDPGRASLPSISISPPAPNPWPASGAPRFAFDLPEAGPACLEIYDAAGRLVARRLESAAVRGRNVVSWNPGALASGAYFVRVATPSGRSARVRWTVMR